MQRRQARLDFQLDGNRSSRRECTISLHQYSAKAEIQRVSANRGLRRIDRHLATELDAREAAFLSFNRATCDTDQSQQLAAVDGFEKEKLNSGLKGTFHHRPVFLTGNHYDHRGGARAGSTNLPGELDAIRWRHADIQKNGMKLVCL